MLYTIYTDGYINIAMGNVIDVWKTYREEGKKVPKTYELMNQNVNIKNISLDGNKFIVEKQYLMPILQSGMVVFVGEKEGYGNTIIVQQVDGVDVWYSNITSNVKLYDYIEKNS